MKNLFTYYITIIAPLIALYMISKYSAVAFTLGLVFYAFIYRTVTDGLRLASKNILTKKEIWKLALPFGYRLKYFKELYLKQ